MKAETVPTPKDFKPSREDFLKRCADAWDVAEEGKHRTVGVVYDTGLGTGDGLNIVAHCDWHGRLFVALGIIRHLRESEPKLSPFANMTLEIWEPVVDVILDKLHKHPDHVCGRDCDGRLVRPA